VSNQLTDEINYMQHINGKSVRLPYTINKNRRGWL